eukprot:m.112974 g.112974  ORF g.112974 m.112974 type:complete len:60 (+) comp15344_c1_seq9:405-584(+)
MNACAGIFVTLASTLFDNNNNIHISHDLQTTWLTPTQLFLSFLFSYTLFICLVHGTFCI